MRLALCNFVMGFGLIAANAAAETSNIRVTPPLKPAAPAAFAQPSSKAAPAAPVTAAVPATPSTPAEPATTANAPPVKPPVPAGFAGVTLAALPTMPAKAVNGPGKLMLDAVVIAGAAPVYEPMLWTVSVPSKVKNQPDEIVATQTSATPQFQLPPGHYNVTAQYGDAKTTQEMEVVAGENRRTFDLRAGVIRMQLIPYRGAKPIEDPIDWEVYAYAQGDVDESRKLAAVTAPQQRFILSDGHYIVRARYGDTVTDLVVPVPAGTSFKYTVNLYAGKVKMSAISHETNRPYKKEIIWSVYRAKPDANGQRQLVATQFGPQITFQLREGKYIVVGQAGDLVGEMPFDIKAGKTEQIKIVLNQPAPVAEPAAATEPAATEPAATGAPAAEPAAPAPPPTKPVTAEEPAATEPAATEPAATEPAATEPAAAEPATTEQPTPAAEPTGTEPSAATSG